MEKENKDKSKSRKLFPLILLAFIVLLGFYLRIYHISYPVIGYHNWKEVHYLSEARNFAREGFFTHGFFIPRWDYPGLNNPASGVHGDTLPTISILAALSFELFGYKLWAARIVGILASTFSIALVYLIVKNLFKREDISLVAAFLTAVNPLFAFYAHNVQLMNVGLSFTLLSIYLFLKWRQTEKNHLLILTAIFLSLGGLTKYPFLIVAVPMLSIFPFHKLKRIKDNLFPYFVSFLILLSIPAWLYYASYHITQKYDTKTSTRVSSMWKKPFTIFTSKFQMTKSYIKDNFSWPSFILSILGVFIFLVSLFKNRDSLKTQHKFLLGYLVALVPFLVIMGGKMIGHNYHYFPIAPLFILLMSYFLAKLGDFTKKLKVEGKGIPHLNFIVI